MTTLWNRASPRELRALRIVAGAVLNARDAHREAPVDRKFARSVAKRAIGTLSSQWGEVLAASEQRPSLAERERASIARRRKAQLVKLCRKGPARTLRRWPHLALAVKEISRQIGDARRAGQLDRAEGMIECLRIIDRIVKREIGASL